MSDESALEPQELANIAKGRAAFYALLNVHFTTLPDKSFIEQVRNDDFAAMLDSITKDTEANSQDLIAGAGLMRDYIQKTRGDATEQLAEKLGVDRTRLYRGVAPGYGPPPPYESVWNPGREGTAVLQAVAGIYREDGLAPSPDATERVDYIGVELDYMREMAKREAEAWESGNRQIAGESLKAQRRFMDEHIGVWVQAFIDKALEQVETDFYRGHLLMLRAFVAEEQERLPALLEELAETA
jgi:putative dimethyl sulfoxide reductase chaperone